MTKFVRAFLFSMALLTFPILYAQTKAKPAAEQNTLIDINSASADTLKSIPGIGDAYSAAIVKGRPYKRKDELVDRKIIPSATYEKIKGLIIARQK